MTNLFVLGHTLKTGMKVVTGGSIQVGLADLAIHLILQLVEVCAGLAVHFELEVNEKGKVFILLLGILFHKLSQGLTLDELRYDCPFAFDHGNFQDLRDVQAGAFDSGLV